MKFNFIQTGFSQAVKGFGLFILHKNIYPQHRSENAATITKPQTMANKMRLNNSVIFQIKSPTNSVFISDNNSFYHLLETCENIQQ